MRPATTGEHVVVETKAGAVRGFWRTDSAAFLGIPFAEPPYGDLRFLPPVQVRSWSGVRDALRYGPTPQRKALAEITTIPEPSIPGEDNPQPQCLHSPATTGQWVGGTPSGIGLHSRRRVCRRIAGQPVV